MQQSRFNLSPEPLAELDTLEKQFSSFESEVVKLKLENQRLRDEVDAKERENQQLYQENQDLRKTRNFSHAAPPEEYTEPEQVVNNIEGIVTDAETGESIRAATIKIENQTTKQIYQTHSNESGRFSLPLPFAWYSVTISADGYLPVTGPVRFGRNKAVTLIMLA